jgi:hypothetical protein
VVASLTQFEEAVQHVDVLGGGVSPCGGLYQAAHALRLNALVKLCFLYMPGGVHDRQIRGALK